MAVTSEDGAAAQPLVLAYRPVDHERFGRLEVVGCTRSSRDCPLPLPGNVQKYSPEMRNAR